MKEFMNKFNSAYKKAVLGSDLFEYLAIIFVMLIVLACFFVFSVVLVVWTFPVIAVTLLSLVLYLVIKLAQNWPKEKLGSNAAKD